MSKDIKVVQGPCAIYSDLYKNVHVPDGVVLRPAKLSDWPQIEEMSREADVLQGRDYLADVFEEYLKEPSILITVAEKEGNIVALSAITCDGNILSGYAGRSSVKERGLGIFRMLWVYHQASYPSNIKRLYGMTPYVDFWIKWGKENPNGQHKTFFIIEEHPLAFKQPIEVIRVALMNFGNQENVYKINFSSVRRIGREQLQNILEDKTVVSELFPANVINLAIQPFPAVRRNLDYFINSLRQQVYCGWDLSGKVTSISFGMVYQCPIGMRYDIAYYSSHGQLNIVLAHVEHHLEELVTRYHRYGGQITAQVNYPRGLLDTEKLQEMLMKIGLTGGTRKISPALVHSHAKL